MQCTRILPPDAGPRQVRRPRRKSPATRGLHAGDPQTVFLCACIDANIRMIARTRSASGTTAPRRTWMGFLREDLSGFPRSTPCIAPAISRRQAGRRADGGVHGARRFRASGLNGGPRSKPDEAFSFQSRPRTRPETDRYWNAIVGNSERKRLRLELQDRWGVSWQDHPRRIADRGLHRRRSRGNQAR